MNMKFVIKREYSFFLTLVISFALVLLTVFLPNIQNSDGLVQNNAITNLKAYSNDKEILLQWEYEGDDQIELSVRSSDGRVKEKIVLNKKEKRYSYAAGEHGEKYTFSLSVGQLNASDDAICEQSALFLDYEKLPDIPIVHITTKNEEMPSYTVVYAPEGYMGQSVIDNEYVSARITISEKNINRVSSIGKIRIRGNTSATSSKKKPFKIKLENPIDLLGRDNAKYADAEWLLIASDYSLKTEAGMKLSGLCGLEWQPQFKPVNLMLNGDWLGCYYLFESISVGPHRLAIDETGFLIENDAYWWKEESYFQTPYQRYDIAYTFKYPQSGKISNERINEISAYVSAYESSLMEGFVDYTQYMDITSFANWILVHDILGTWDSGGSNMYLYKHDMHTESKLKVGPAWDLFSAFMQKDQWSRIHYEELMHYDTLFQKEDFVKTYVQRWKALSDSVVIDIVDYLEAYVQQKGKALQESWILDAEKYGVEAPCLENVAEETKNWFETRKVWLDGAVNKLGF